MPGKRGGDEGRKQQVPQRQPGRESEMRPRPQDEREHIGAGKLAGKVALITGGDSGIGRAVAIAFAKEGADISIVYLEEDNDAQETQARVEAVGRRCLLLRGDIGDEAFCREVIGRTVGEFGKLDILVNNAAEQHVQDGLERITREQLERTFRTNIFGMFFLTKAALRHLRDGAAIINTTSVTAYKGNPQLIDYASTKGVIVSFTRSLALSLAQKGIRVNGVAPGPIWTPLIPASFPKEALAEFGKDTPLQRPGQPAEVAPCYIFLASEDSSYMTGQVLHPNGGTVGFAHKVLIPYRRLGVYAEKPPIHAGGFSSILRGTSSRCSATIAECARAVDFMNAQEQLTLWAKPGQL